MGTGVLFRM